MKKSTSKQATLRTLHPPVLPGSEMESKWFHLLAMAFCSGQVSFRFVENKYLKEAFEKFMNARLPHRRLLPNLIKDNDKLILDHLANILGQVAGGTG